MSGTVLSNSWYRVADLKPRLRTHARLYRHRYRGELWYLLQDAASDRVHRFTPAARLIIAAMDGKRTVQQLWELASRRLMDDAPTQDDMINLLGQLHAADLLQTDVTPDTAEVFDRGERQGRAKRLRSFTNPMAVKIHLWDPDTVLDRMRGAIDVVWSRYGALMWLAVVLPALVLLPAQWNDLTHNFSDQVLAVDNLLLLLIVFPLIKALHELGHAAAVKRGGGEVHDVGIVMLVLIPVPYVEASASTVFKSKWQRAMVGAAGMAVEIFIAAVAFYIWMLVEPGTVRAVLFNVMLVAGVSTLIFNGNPLLRYDAYYILADLLEMPNLASRSQKYWGYLVERYAFGVDDSEAPARNAAERGWFLFYGVASFIYRIFVTIAIALFVASGFFIIGVVLAIWAVFAMAVLPVGKSIAHVVTSARLQSHRKRAVTVTGGAVLALLLLACAMPVRHRTVSEGVVWMPEHALLRAGHEGFAEPLLVTPAARVTAGEVIMRLRDPSLEAQERTAQAKVAELQAAYAAAFVTDRVQAKILNEQLEAERAALGVLHERMAKLVVRAGTTGTLVVARPRDMVGRYYRKGDLLGHIVDDSSPIARVVVPQDVVDRVRQLTRRVEARYAHRPEVAVPARIVREVPAGEEYLPSRALATDGGGAFVVDPRDTRGAKTLERTFQLDIGLGEPAPGGSRYFGERVYVRFEHPMEPLAVQVYRSVRQLFLSRFSV